MTVEEVQTRKDKILAEAKKEKPFSLLPVNYELLKKYKYVDSPDSFVSPPSDSETDTPEKVKARTKEYDDASLRGEIFYPNLIKVDLGTPLPLKLKTKQKNKFKLVKTNSLLEPKMNSSFATTPASNTNHSNDLLSLDLPFLTPPLLTGLPLRTLIVKLKS